MMRDRRLLILAVGHLILGVVAGLLAHIQLSDPFGLSGVLPPFGLRDILVVPLVATALCQALLLALWGATSRASPWARMAGLVAGAVYLEALFPQAMRRETLGSSTITIAVTTLILIAVRTLGVRFSQADQPGHPAGPENRGIAVFDLGHHARHGRRRALRAPGRGLSKGPRGRLSC